MREDKSGSGLEKCGKAVGSVCFLLAAMVLVVLVALLIRDDDVPASDGSYRYSFGSVGVEFRRVGDLSDDVFLASIHRIAGLEYLNHRDPEGYSGRCDIEVFTGKPVLITENSSAWFRYSCTDNLKLRDVPPKSVYGDVHFETYWSDVLSIRDFLVQTNETFKKQNENQKTDL